MTFSWKRCLILGAATVGFISYGPYKIIPFTKWKGGGLLGSLVGWGFVWFFPSQGWVLWISTAVLLVFSISVSHYAEKLLGSHDDPRIVIDEVLGVWVATLGIPREWVAMVTALFLFRFFDVFKGPWGRWAARAPGGWGIVADDFLAGLIANGLVHLFW
jgi:phosphatidylglycerophosphatase A